MDGERGFHIFYQLLTGVTSSSEKEKLHLRPPEFFAFLKKSKELRIAAKDDRTEYDETKRAMLISGFGEEEIFEIWRVVAAILWLGEVEFSQGTASEQAIVTQSEAVTVVAGKADFLNLLIFWVFGDFVAINDDFC